jgi:protein-disulfide isomerase
LVNALENKPSLVPHWRDYLVVGERIGPTDAPVQLLEFADFECPFCSDFHKTLKAVRQRHPTQVSLAYIHLPLAMHRFSLPAARVADCAGQQGRFEQMYDELFEHQESFGLRAWSEYGAAAGVPDLGRFDTCVKSTDPIRRVEEGKKLGTELDVRATPTVIINGWKLGRPPNADQLDAMVRSILAGKSPVDVIKGT